MLTLLRSLEDLYLSASQTGKRRRNKATVCIKVVVQSTTTTAPPSRSPAKSPTTPLPTHLRTRVWEGSRPLRSGVFPRTPHKIPEALRTPRPAVVRLGVLGQRPSILYSDSDPCRRSHTGRTPGTLPRPSVDELYFREPPELVATRFLTGRVHLTPVSTPTRVIILG